MAVGAWADEGLPITGPPTLYMPPPELSNACGDAKGFQTPFPQPGFEYTPFSNAEAAFAAEVGTWVRCADSAASERAGIQILADGTWRDLALESGALVARTGFDHEGTTRAEATQGDPPGLYMLSFSGGSGNWGAAPVSNRALVVPSTTNYWPPAVYLPTTLPVRVPPSQFVDGEKAGAAGCNVGEQGIVAAVDEAAAALEGTFVLCSGDFGAGTTGIRFAGGRVERLGEGGVVLEAPSYEFEQEMNPNIVSLRLSDGRYWLVNVSRSPRKLWIQAADLKPWPATAVLSAML